MLEGLERIDWSGLDHAYGPATNVPGLIRALADGAEEVRKQAIYELFSNIVHQGSVYAATAQAVPFLIELLEEPAVPGKERILDLLQAISQGWLDCQRYATQSVRLPPAVAERRAQELPHYQSAHAAVEKAFAVFVRLFEDADVAVRIGAAFVLATMTNRRADAAVALLDAIDDGPHDHCRGALLLALAVLAEQQPDDRVADTAARRFEAIFNELSDAHAARLAAAIAMLRLGKLDLIPQVVALVRQYLVTDGEIFLDLPWHEANNLLALVDGGLRPRLQARIAWIIEGLDHRDPAVRDAAMYCGGELCREHRTGPAALLARFARLVDHPDADVRKEAIQTLAGMGKLGIECVKGFRRHALPDVRGEVAETQKRVQSWAKERASWLAEKRPLLLPSVARLLETIARHQGSRKWTDEHQVREAVVCLGFHGPKAVAAVEVLRAIAAHESPWIRVHAIRALWKITGDAALVVPLLRASLRPEPAAFLIVDCLKQIGAVAREALPELRRIIESEERYMTSGLTDEICSTDEAFRDACVEVVQAIEQGP